MQEKYDGSITIGKIQHAGAKDVHNKAAGTGDSYFEAINGITQDMNSTNIG
jgi:hypothetical protein